MTQPQEKWEEGFDERFVSENNAGKTCWSVLGMRHEDVKVFISSLLQDKERETIERVFDFIDNAYLAVCRHQNGRPGCRNCGLDMEELRTRFLPEKPQEE